LIQFLVSHLPTLAHKKISPPKTKPIKKLLKTNSFAFKPNQTPLTTTPVTMMMMSQNMSSMHNNNTNTNNTSADSSVSAFAPLNVLPAATLPVNNSSNSTLNNNNNNDANHSNSANSSITSNASNNNAYDNSSNSLESLALSNSSSYLADSTSSLDSSTDRSLDGAASFKQLDDSQKKSKTAKKHCKNPSQKSKKQLSTRKPLGSSSGSETASG